MCDWCMYVCNRYFCVTAVRVHERCVCVKQVSVCDSCVSNACVCNRCVCVTSVCM